MKSLLTILCFSVVCFSASAQWQKINIGTTQDLYDIQMTGRTGYIAGENSTILKSSDSGRSWKGLALSIPSHLRAVYFIDSLTGFVTGENARIQKTVNGGKTWTQKYVQTATYANAITFSGNFGIAVGNRILAVRSDNYGETWTEDTTLRSPKALNSVCILPGGMCWAVGDSGYILKKDLLRKKWTIVNSPTTINLNYICNIGDSVLIATGGMTDSAQAAVHKNVVLRSTDGGKTWSSIAIPEMKTIRTGWFFNKDTGFLAGSSGLINRCFDPFVKRNRQLSGTASMINKLFFYNEKGFAVGDGGTFSRTANSGGFGLNIERIDNFNKINIYPNPSNGEFFIHSETPIKTLHIYDVYGRCIQSYENLSETSPLLIPREGLFLLSLEFDNGTKSEKKIIVRKD